MSMVNIRIIKVLTSANRKVGVEINSVLCEIKETVGGIRLRKDIGIAVKVIVIGSEQRKLGQPDHLARHTLSPLRNRTGEVGDLGESSSELVMVDAERFKIGEVRDLPRKAAADTVLVKIEPLECGELSDVWR